MVEPKIAIQAHIYYEDLISEMINKINNIPVKYDLFISTNSIKIKHIINLYIKKLSNLNNYEILIYENKGRDVLPLLLQLNFKIIKKYKYFCHIHTKKTTFTNFGDDWRKYLLENLLGSKDIVAEIAKNNYPINEWINNLPGGCIEDMTLIKEFYQSYHVHSASDQVLLTSRL